MRSIVIALLVCAAIAACGWNGSVQNPESRDYPCGPQGVVCSGSYPHASCCWENEECGSGSAFTSRCPEGYCCYVGHENAFGMRPAKWQWTPKP